MTDFYDELRDENAMLSALNDAQRATIQNLVGENKALEAENAHMVAELVKARRIINGWANWHRRVAGDSDDLPYLNGKAWDDAEALADNSETFLRRKPLAGGGDE